MGRGGAKRKAARSCCDSPSPDSKPVDCSTATARASLAHAPVLDRESRSELPEHHRERDRVNVPFGLRVYVQIGPREAVQRRRVALPRQLCFEHPSCELADVHSQVVPEEAPQGVLGLLQIQPSGDEQRDLGSRDVEGCGVQDGGERARGRSQRRSRGRWAGYDAVREKLISDSAGRGLSSQQSQQRACRAAEPCGGEMQAPHQIFVAEGFAIVHVEERVQLTAGRVCGVWS